MGTRHQDIVYAEKTLLGEPTSLSLDLYLPDDNHRPFPCVFLLHGGAFRGGHKAQAKTQVGAECLNELGWALASASYRLRGGPSDLNSQFANAFDLLEPNRDLEFKAAFAGHRSLVALEDAHDAFVWLDKHHGEFGLSRRFVLGGFSVGAVTAFNLALLRDHLGLEHPKAEAVLSMSGGFAYPDLVGHENMVPTFALHDPTDERLPIGSIRKLAARFPDQVKLHETTGIDHGSPRLKAGEPARRAWSRMINFVESQRSER